MRRIVTLLVFLAPAGRPKNRVLRLLGHDVHPTASIAPNLVVDVARFEIGPDVRIGPFNVFRCLRSVRLDTGAVIGQLNWFSSAPTFVGTAELAASLVMAESAAVVSRHHVDCSGGVVMGRFSILGGMASILLTHHVSHLTNQLECAPIRIGEYALLNAANRMVAGSVLPDRSLTGIGSVVLPGLTAPGRLYAGSPARDIKSVAGGQLFDRNVAAATL